MFKKLLSNLPFNPSLLGQVSFYMKRLRREQAVRRAGFFVLGLVFLVQLFAFISPPQPTIANSNNDIMNGGFGSQGEMVSDCNTNFAGFGDILAYFNISCDNVAAGQVINLNSRDFDSQLYSMGRIAYGKSGETPVDVNGTTFWLRYLWSWDTYGSSNYQAVQGVSRTGQTFFILFDCGNLVFIGLPPPPTPACIWNPALLASDPSCKPPVCPYDNSIDITNPACEACPYDGSITKTNPRCVVCPNPRYPNITKDNPGCKPVCPYNKAIDKDNPACKPCEESQTQEDKTSCLELRKTVRNITQNISDANNTTAAPGDTLEYTLSVTNKGSAQIDKFVIQEDLNDVLDYADIVNLNGGTMDDKNIVKWPAQKIKAKETISQSFTVRVKNPIPQSPTSSSDPGHYDLAMTNVYGNAITVKVPGGTTKTIQMVTNTLPNTGPGESIAIAFGIAVIAGFFFARTRLMAKEIGIVRAVYIHNGGPS